VARYAARVSRAACTIRVYHTRHAHTRGVYHAQRRVCNTARWRAHMHAGMRDTVLTQLTWRVTSYTARVSFTTALTP
jgi:hypothetical protein